MRNVTPYIVTRYLTYKIPFDHEKTHVNTRQKSCRHSGDTDISTTEMKRRRNGGTDRKGLMKNEFILHEKTLSDALRTRHITVVYIY